MKIYIRKTKEENGAAAAASAAEGIQEALRKKGECNLILATGASQFEMLDRLVQTPDIDWTHITIFHLDEYIGIPATHPASFRRYLLDRVVSRLPRLKAFIGVQGDAPDIEAECSRLEALLDQAPVDVACIGIGENGHLAFNDPPADFSSDRAYLTVTLDLACRRQQLGEGWFPTLEAVPTRAVTMTIKRIMSSGRLVVTVPDQRKAQAVLATVKYPVDRLHPSTILRRHPDAQLFLDEPAATLLPNKMHGREIGE